ncbi:MAG: PspC domain-containing protein [Spirochaetales bacterium]|jgi:phage shock protein C|nr:PspC domain-containing protein [Spirochaetales bacterium]
MRTMATRKLYRSRRGKVFGICAGIAEWRDLNVDIVRLIVGISILSTGFFPGALIYLAAALIIPMAPEGQTFEQRYEETVSDSELKRKYENLKKKVEEMESEVLNKERDWDDRFFSGK